MVVGRLSYWEGNFWGAMLNFGRVNPNLIHTKWINFVPHKYLESVNVLPAVGLLHPLKYVVSNQHKEICIYNIQINVPTSIATCPNIGFCI